VSPRGARLWSDRYGIGTQPSPTGAEFRVRLEPWGGGRWPAMGVLAGKDIAAGDRSRRGLAGRDGSGGRAVA
jgi:hypothetical protein